MPRVVPGLLGIFGPGTLVVMFCRTSRDALSCPRTSDLDLVVISGRTSRDVRSCSRTSLDL